MPELKDVGSGPQSCLYKSLILKRKTKTLEHLHHSKKVIVMMAVISAMLFVSLSQTIVNTALPRIVAELGGIEYFSWGVFSMFYLLPSVPAVLIGKTI